MRGANAPSRHATFFAGLFLIALSLAIGFSTAGTVGAAQAPRATVFEAVRVYLVEGGIFLLICPGLLLYKQAQIVRCAAIVLGAFIGCGGFRRLAAQKG